MAKVVHFLLLSKKNCPWPTRQILFCFTYNTYLSPDFNWDYVGCKFIAGLRHLSCLSICQERKPLNSQKRFIVEKEYIVFQVSKYYSHPTRHSLNFIRLPLNEKPVTTISITAFHYVSSNPFIYLVRNTCNVPETPAGVFINFPLK